VREKVRNVPHRKRLKRRTRVETVQGTTAVEWKCNKNVRHNDKRKSKRASDSKG